MPMPEGRLWWPSDFWTTPQFASVTHRAKGRPEHQTQCRGQIKSTEHKVRIVEYEVQSTKYKSPRKKYGVQSMEVKVQNTKDKVQSTKRSIRGTLCGVQSIEYSVRRMECGVQCWKCVAEGFRPGQPCAENSPLGKGGSH